MSASPASPALPPGAPRLRTRALWRRAGADRRILLLTRRKSQPPGRSLTLRNWKTGTPAAAHGKNNWASACGSPRPSARCAACAASACASRSSRGSAARPARQFRRHPPRARKRPRVAYALLNAHDLLRDAWKALNDRKRMSLKTGAGFRGISADNAYGVIRPEPQRMQSRPGRLDRPAGLATTPGFGSPTPPARRRTSLPQAE